MKTVKAQMVGVTYTSNQIPPGERRKPSKEAMRGLESQSGHRPLDDMLRNWITWGPSGVLRTKGEKIQVTWEIEVIRIGAAMEDANVLLRETQAECQKIKAELEKTSAEMGRLRDVMLPDLRYFLDQVRALRMGLDQEMKHAISSLNEVRHFFIAKDYETEIARLKDFLVTVEKIRVLQRDGTLDGIVDLMLRLACQEEASNVRK